MLVDYRPAWWLPGPHTMTMWSKFFRARTLPELTVRRVPAADGDAISLAAPASEPDGPLVLVLHGLEGGTRSHYVGGFIEAVLNEGWRARLLLFRTCDGTMAPVRRTYHSGETTDLDAVVRHLVDGHPGVPIGLIGVSLGANVLLKWLGEQQDRLPDSVRAAVAVSTPFDLARGSRAIGTGFSRLYEWNFLRSLKAKARAKLAQYPDVLDATALNDISSMWDFDDRFTAPLHGFQDAADYYRRSSSLGFLDRVRRPTLLVSAYDDPFHTPSVLRDVEVACANNRWIELAFHARGGHVGFVGGTPWNPRYYLDEWVVRFLREHLTTSQSAVRSRE